MILFRLFQEYRAKRKKQQIFREKSSTPFFKISRITFSGNI